jgi:hypothetical protein
VLNADFDRSRSLPSDYETDLELEWSNPSEWITLIVLRQVMILQIYLPMATTSRRRRSIGILTRTLQMHLNVGQTFDVDSASAGFSLQVIADLAALPRRQLTLNGDTRVTIPSQLNTSAFVSLHRYSIRVSAC